MIAKDTLSALAELLLLLEKELRDLGLWEDTLPSGADLESELPFCFDTLTFPQWLQWVFIQQFKTTLEEGEHLPISSEIGPFAEEELRDSELPVDQLLAIIEAIDIAINDNASKEPPLH
jgi:uncharacterized protein YqcC (DUF446 family)